MCRCTCTCALRCDSGTFGNYKVDVMLDVVD